MQEQKDESPAQIDPVGPGNWSGDILNKGEYLFVFLFAPNLKGCDPALNL